MNENAKLSSLLKWAVQNSDTGPDSQNPSTATESTQSAHDPQRGLDPEALAELMGGPSDADRMRDAMAAITSPSSILEQKLIAFDNFELLIENLDNANNMEPLGLWMPLVEQLHDPEPQIRRMAAWCCATAVQNNVKAQERLLVVGGVKAIAQMACKEMDKEARKKAILALSSAVRNYQPNLDVVVKELPEGSAPVGKVDANDMEAVDAIVGKLREGLAGMS